ncbi:MAG: NADP-dependent malic enzyme, partial [Muribaculaceae bacterium]|nr:NADP-dependent malic enzyme [Muribaculaceae bacterium]
MHIMITRRGTYFLADTAINPVSDSHALVDIARLANDAVKHFNQEAVMAMLSFSNFGSNSKECEPARVAEAVRILHEKYPELQVDGEMQADYALNTKLRDKAFPFNTLKGKEVNTLIFPNLSASNIAYKLLVGMGVGNVIGPIQVGLNKPIYFTGVNSKVDEIINIAEIAALDYVISSRKQE